jgi:serine/threonine protein kinase
MAVKLFNAISSYDFENEKAVLSHIRRGNVHKNVLINYGSLVHPEERSSNLVRALLLPWTDFGTLENLMKDNRNRDTPTKRRNNIHGMVGVADALAWLSQMKISLPRIPTRKVQVMHCDIKPQNILVFPAPDQEDRFIFKVSDFGHAFLSMSIRRPSPRYESTYCAPEIAWGNRIVEKNSDVWPFGCVLLLVLVFTTRGYQEITILRENLQDNGTYDTFYESTAEPTRYRLKRPVSNWIENLRKGALSTEDINETEMTKETGKILHEYILVPDYKSRKDMAFICEKLEAAYSTVHTALETNSFSDYPGLDQYTLCTIPTKAEYICFHSNNMNRCGVFFIDTLLFQGRLPIIRPMIHQPETIWARRFSLTVSTCTSSDICLVRDASQYNLVVS